MSFPEDTDLFFGATDMQTSSLIRLLILAAIWGGSFILMRIGVAILGPVMLIESRVVLAALFLLGVGAVMRKRLNAREHWKHYLVIGLFNSALPFLLFAYAAQTLTASLLSILNATSPIWGAVIGATWTRQPLSLKTVLGLFLGVAGVSVLVGFDTAALQPGAGIAVIAALTGAFSYGIATTYAKSAKQVDPFSNAHGSMWAAAFLIAPGIPFSMTHPTPGADIMLLVLALGIVCSGIAYLLYFRLIADIGATSALTVTFLIPVFGILWGNLLLGESITLHTMAGTVIVIVGTALVTGFSPAAILPKKTVANG
jgi:drug/metabolite transporter (DMT)-like permease